MVFVFEGGLTVPWQNVSTPLHLPVERHVLESDPLNKNPSSQLNVIVLGKVVFDPNDEPFFGLCNGPQSLAVRKKKVKDES